MFYVFLIYFVFPFLCLQSVQENNLVKNLYRSVTTYSSGFAALYLVQAILYEQGSMKTGAPGKVWGIPYFYGGPPSTGSTTLTQSHPVPGGQGWLGAPLWGLLTSTLSLYTPLYILLILIHCSKLGKRTGEKRVLLIGVAHIQTGQNCGKPSAVRSITFLGLWLYT